MKGQNKRLTKAILFITMASMMAMSSCAPASGDTSSTSNTSGETSAADTASTGSESSSDSGETLVLDVFSGPSNFMGTQGGWYGKLIKDKFNIELNIISPNVAGGGNTLYQTRSAAGDLGDLIIVSRDQFRDVVKAGLVADITDKMADAQYLSDFQLGIDGLKEYLETDKVYGIPTWCSTRSPSEPDIAGLDPTDGTYLRFDYFSEIGAPDLKTYEDLLDALRQMQDAHPTTESGQKIYGLSFFKDWDGGNMKMANCLTNQLGYSIDSTGFILKNGDGTESVSIIDKSGAYYRSLEILFTANQMGLVDPDSSSQTWDDYTAKVANGAVLFAPWPWASITHFNDQAKENEGIGYAFVPVEEAKYWVNGCNPYGGDGNVIGIGSGVENLDRVFEFLDWYASVENTSCYESTMGPEGYLWDIVDGKSVPNEQGQLFLQSPSEYEAPAEMGGGLFMDGMIQTNTIIRSTRDTNPETGESIVYEGWASIIEDNRTVLDDNWTERYGSENPKEYVLSNGMYELSPGCLLNLPVEPSELATTRTACSETLINASWKMIFAKDRAEFDQIWDDMVEEMYGLGYEDCLEWDEQMLEIYKTAKLGAMQGE